MIQPEAEVTFYRPQLRCRTSGAALILVLAFIVLMTGLALAFFSRATNERQVSSSSATQTKAALFAEGALDQIVADLKQEIVAGSTAVMISGTTIYEPAPTAATKPALVGSNASAGYENLVKRSVYNTAFHPYANASNRAAGPSTQAATTLASVNGRFISPARWNKPLLIAKQTPGTDTDLTPASTFTPPDWILLARDGSNPSAWNANMRTSATSATAVLGRYAYMIYDEGGLLDANAAGYPSPTPAPATPVYGSTIGRKGPVSLADLTQLSGISNMTTTRNGVVLQNKVINDIIGWRNFASAAATGVLGTLSSTSTYTFASNSYYDAVLSNQTGFLTTANTVLRSGQSDRMFGSRQALTRFLIQGVASTAGDRANLQNSLQCLGTFSRELNAPSWGPSADASSAGGSNGVGAIPPYAYLTNRNTSQVTNLTNTGTVSNPTRLIPNVRVATTFIRADGSAAVVGEPLVKNRFPLSRLNSLGTTGVNTSALVMLSGTLQAATAATVQRDFGLIWNTDHWDYVGGSGTTVQSHVMTLAEVAGDNPPRQPNFFELLEAGILSGSVGLGSGNANTFISADSRFDPTNALSADTQIVQMGANIIDQWDADSVPTFITFGGNQLAGIENLPYLSKLVFKPYQDSSSNTYQAWLIPSLWNPWQNASSTGHIRVTYTGTGATASFFQNNGHQFNSQALPNAFMEIDSAAFTTSPTSAANLAATSSPNITASLGANGFGFEYTFTGTPPSLNNQTQAYPDFAGSGTFDLQVLVAGAWKTYQRWAVPVMGHPLVCDTNGNGINSSIVDPEAVALDPRTTRFGIWGNAAHISHISQDFTLGPFNTLDDTVGGGAHQWEPVTALGPTNANFHNVSGGSLYRYSDNLDDPTGRSPVYYTDLDGVQRPGDFPAPGTTYPNQLDTDEPIIVTDAISFDFRPRMLNGQFQSVAEMGQTFRDQPWKTLNFMSKLSADAGLLDIFTIQESTPVSGKPPMTAGKASLNTRQTPVLSAILSQALKTLSPTMTTVSPTEQSSIIAALMSLTATAPMVNKSELVTRLSADASVTELGTSVDTLSPPAQPKEAREAVVRAFSDATQTRTWNLMIDVIAQSGRYPPNATGLANFIVEGEKRYWLHVAIDRFTGQVIDQQLEAVYE